MGWDEAAVRLSDFTEISVHLTREYPVQVGGRAYQVRQNFFHLNGSWVS